MAIILNINTAFETACIFLSVNDEILFEAQNEVQKDHASFLEPAIKHICSAANVALKEINAVSVVNGPGSYTGLRVGLSSAKAICYALNKPLILLNTLDVMAYALRMQANKLKLLTAEQDVLFCPLIDARRMEVYTALYDCNLTLINTYASEVLNESFLENEKKTKTIIAGGTGSYKIQQLVKRHDIVLINPLLLEKPAAILAYKAFSSNQFANIAYCEPFYIKSVYFNK